MLSFLKNKIITTFGLYDVETLRLLRAASAWKHAGETEQSFPAAAEMYLKAEADLCSAVLALEEKHGRQDV